MTKPATAAIIEQLHPVNNQTQILFYQLDEEKKHVVKYKQVTEDGAVLASPTMSPVYISKVALMQMSNGTPEWPQRISCTCTIFATS